MRVIQVNVFLCEKCANTTSTTTDTGTYDDPVIIPPPGWDEEYDELCPNCRPPVPKEKSP